jgi:hypothetical protein
VKAQKEFLKAKDGAGRFLKYLKKFQSIKGLTT